MGSTKPYITDRDKIVEAAAALTELAHRLLTAAHPAREPSEVAMLTRAVEREAGELVRGALADVASDAVFTETASQLTARALGEPAGKSARQV